MVVGRVWVVVKEASRCFGTSILRRLSKATRYGSSSPGASPLPAVAGARFSRCVSYDTYAIVFGCGVWGVRDSLLEQSHKVVDSGHHGKLSADQARGERLATCKRYTSILLHLVPLHEARRGITP